MPRIKSKRFSIRLPILLTFVFTSITVSVGGYIGHQHYQRSKQLILDQTHTLVDAFSDEFVLALEQTYRPINTVLEILSYFPAPLLRPRRRNDWHNCPCWSAP